MPYLIPDENVALVDAAVIAVAAVIASRSFRTQTAPVPYDVFCRSMDLVFCVFCVFCHSMDLVGAAAAAQVG
jgi:hypothetical protein